MAYESGALSPAGRARVEKHLRTCGACQRELATIQTYEATVDAIREADAPDLDWSKMELALEREAQLQAKKHRRGWMLPAMGVALAAAAALAIVMPPASPPREVAVAHVPPTGTAPPSTVAHVDLYAASRVTLVAGQSARHAGAPGAAPLAALALGDPLAEGETIATSEGAELHARLGDEVGIALGPSTSLRLARFEDGELPAPELDLAHGEMTVYAASSRTIVLAGQFRIEADVARFVVDFDEEAGALALDVHEGSVRVVGPDVDTTLTGPARFPESAGPHAGLAPHGLDAGYDEQPTLRVSRDGIVRWQIGDLAIAGADRLAMRVGIGPLQITGWDARGHAFRTSVTMGPEGLALAPDALEPEAPRIRVGTLEREEIVPVVHQHQSAVTRCYEHQLRATPELQAHVTARIAIEMTGAVDTVTFEGDEMPAPMAECLSNQIGTWIFPAPHGGPVTIGVPFTFAAR